MIIFLKRCALHADQQLILRPVAHVHGGLVPVAQVLARRQREAEVSDQLHRGHLGLEDGHVKAQADPWKGHLMVWRKTPSSLRPPFKRKRAQPKIIKCFG